MPSTHRPRGVVLVESIAVIAFTGLLAPLLLRLATEVSTPAAAFAATACALLGYLAADVASGMVHWFCGRRAPGCKTSWPRSRCRCRSSRS